MVDCSSSKRCVSIQLRLTVIRVSNLTGKGFSCRENRCRIVADLTRMLSISINLRKNCHWQGKIFAKYCVIDTWMFESSFFRVYIVIHIDEPNC